MIELARIERQLVEIDGWIGEGDAAVATRAPAVSGWSVAQQVDHLLAVAERSLVRVLDEPPALARGRTLTGRIVLALGWFPRGSAKAPKGFEGRELSAADLAGRVAAVRELLARVGSQPALLARREPVVPHPYFGGLTPTQALRNIVVHTEHHLKIVRDIRRAARA